MAFELLEDAKRNRAVFFCNTNMRAFGPVRSIAPMRQIEDIAGVLGLDLRTLPPGRIAEMVADIEASSETKEGKEQ